MDAPGHAQGTEVLIEPAVPLLLLASSPSASPIAISAVLPAGREIAQPTYLLVDEDPCHTRDTGARLAGAPGAAVTPADLAERLSWPHGAQCQARLCRIGTPVSLHTVVNSIDSPTAATASSLAMTL